MRRGPEDITVAAVQAVFKPPRSPRSQQQGGAGVLPDPAAEGAAEEEGQDSCGGSSGSDDDDNAGSCGSSSSSSSSSSVGGSAGRPNKFFQQYGHAQAPQGLGWGSPSPSLDAQDFFSHLLETTPPPRQPGRSPQSKAGGGAGGGGGGGGSDSAGKSGGRGGGGTFAPPRSHIRSRTSGSSGMSTGADTEAIGGSVVSSAAPMEAVAVQEPGATAGSLEAAGQEAAGAVAGMAGSGIVGADSGLQAGQVAAAGCGDAVAAAAAWLEEGTANQFGQPQAPHEIAAATGAAAMACGAPNSGAGSQLQLEGVHEHSGQHGTDRWQGGSRGVQGARGKAGDTVGASGSVDAPLGAGSAPRLLPTAPGGGLQGQAAGQLESNMAAPLRPDGSAAATRSLGGGPSLALPSTGGGLQAAGPRQAASRMASHHRHEDSSGAAADWQRGAHGGLLQGGGGLGAGQASTEAGAGASAGAQQVGPGQQQGEQLHQQQPGSVLRAVRSLGEPGAGLMLCAEEEAMSTLQAVFKAFAPRVRA